METKQTTSATPDVAAGWTLEFLHRATIPMSGDDHDRLGIVKSMLLAIQGGAFIVQPAPQVQAQPEAPSAPTNGTDLEAFHKLPSAH